MDIDTLIELIEEDIQSRIEKVLSIEAEVVEAYETLRKVVKLISTDKNFMKLDQLGILSESGDEKPFATLVETLRKEKAMNPKGLNSFVLIDDIISQTAGLALAIEEYKKYTKTNTIG